MRKILIIVGAVFIAALTAGGCFYGGMAYQNKQNTQARASFFSERGVGEGSLFGPNGQFSAGAPNGERNFAGGRGTNGQIKSIDGNVMSLSTAENVTKVQITDSTQIEITDSGTLSNLQPGTRVLVTGQTGSDGTITADRITIVTGDFPFPGGTDETTPGAGGTAP